jgi:methylenetetrahydrofolate reductase (NADPH)
MECHRKWNDCLAQTRSVHCEFPGRGVSEVNRCLDFAGISRYLPLMQFIREIHAAKRTLNRPVISFELFPPKTSDGDRNLFEKTIPALKELKPDFFSVTYGAGGSTRDKTLMIADRIQREHQIPAMAHLTCVQASKQQIREVLEQARSLGIKNILALRGDPPGGTGGFVKAEGGFEFSHELVQFIREMGGFCIGAAGFPEGHIACREGKFVDWDRLKAKIDCGVDFVLTQLFFDNYDFLCFRDYMVRKLGARLPASLCEKLETFGNDDASATEFGIEYAINQCAELLREGVPGLHLYTLNKAYSVGKILRHLEGMVK